MTPRSVRSFGLLLSAAFVAGFANPTWAQQAAAEPVAPPTREAIDVPQDEEMDAPADAGSDTDESEEIVVTGQRLSGRVQSDIPPEITLDRRQVSALGASNIAELIDALAPQTRSGRGRGDGGPVILLGGRRISGFSEIRDLPPEAIERVEVLAEEVALSYGYRADQRVVNIVLRRRFRAVTAEIEGGLPTAGGRSSSEFDLNLLRLDAAGRWSLDAEYRRDTPLLESERDILGDDGEPVADAAFRTLLPQVDQLTLGGTLNRTLPGDVSATLDARLDATDTVSRFGLPDGGSSSENALTRDAGSRVGHLGVALNGRLSQWRWSFTGNLDRNRSVSLTDVDAPGSPRARDRARSVGQSIDGQVVANGPLFALPAGGATASVRISGATRDFNSDSLAGGVLRTADLARDRAEVLASVDLPIASRRESVLGAIGDVSFNANYEVDRLSDFGTLTTWGLGLNWQPIEGASLIVSITDEKGAPSLQQLGDPLLTQANTRVFDFTRGETAIVTRFEGGNSELVADNRRVVKLGATVKPLGETDLTLSADYTDNRTRDVIAGFPAATPEIETAFADRFVRDADGRLVSVDSRPVNFARSDREELRSGFNFSKPLGKADPARADPRGAGGARGEGAGPRGPGGGGRGGFGRGGFGRGGGFGGRGPGNLQIGLYHTWRFADSILIREGVPELDLLNGSAVGNRGGRSRHEVELQSGVFKDGFGARLTGNWQSGTTVRGLASDAGAGDLRFGDFSTFNLRLFADLGAQEKLVRRYPILRGARISLVADNLFDARLDVRDAAGVTPLGYQGDLLDPLGRSVRISLRKLFFPSRGNGRGGLPDTRR